MSGVLCPTAGKVCLIDGQAAAQVDSRCADGSSSGGAARRLRLRVLTMLHSFDTGGVERIALRLVRRWRRDGVDAPLWVGRPDGRMAAEFADVTHLGPTRSHRLARVAETAWMIAHLPGVVRRVRPDVIFCAGNTYAVVVCALKLRLGRRCPPVVAKISNDLDRADLPLAVRWFYHRWVRAQGRLIDRVVVLAPALRHQAAERLGRAPGRVAIVCDPVLDDRPTLRDERPDGEGRRFVSVGRLAAQKNLGLLLRAFARGRRPDDRLTLIGDGPLAAPLKARAVALGVGEAVVFTGHRAISSAELRRHDVLLLSSDYEGLPAVLVEALAAGLAVVSTASSPAVVDLLDCVGTLVPVADVDALAAAISAPVPLPDRALLAARLRDYHLDAAAPAFELLFADAKQCAAATEARGRAWRHSRSTPLTEAG